MGDAKEYFPPGIMRFNQPIRIKHLCPVPGLFSLVRWPPFAWGAVDKTALGTRLTYYDMMTFSRKTRSSKEHHGSPC